MPCRSAFLPLLLAFVVLLPVSALASDPFQRPDEEVAIILGDQTLRIDDPKRGLRVEYIAKDGRVFRWIPGRARVTVGRWHGRVLHWTDLTVNGKRLGDGSDIQFCYLRDTGRTTTSGTPIISKVGCSHWGWLTEIIIEQVDGDPLGLSRGNIPCRFCDRSTTFAEMGKGSS